MTLLVVYAGIALGASFFCSLAEAAMLSMTPFYVQNLLGERHRSARLLARLESNMDQALAAILSLNTIAHTVGAVGVGGEAARVFGNAYVGVASAVLTLLVLVLSEIIPKTIGATWWRNLAPVLAPVVWALIKLLWPLVWLAERLTGLIARGRPIARFRREELTAMAEVGAEEGELLPEELRIVANLVRLRAIRAADVMTPRIVIFTLDETMTVAEAMASHPEIPFSRIPLFGRDADDIHTVLLKADLYLASARDRHDTVLSGLARPLTAVSTSMSIVDLLEFLIDGGQHMAILIDEYGGVAGLVTLEDIIETLLGIEIVDELDTTENMQELARHLWRERATGLSIALRESEETNDGPCAPGVLYPPTREARMTDTPTRDDAWTLLNEFTDNPSLIKHALSVEAAMRAYARRYNEDEASWGIIGLIHDFDYQQNPTEDTHVHVGTEILRERGWPEDWILTAASHADYMGLPRETLAAKVLFAVDELTGFLTACALVRPDKAIANVRVKSVKKKLKDKAFARAVNRDDVRNGAEELGVELGEHIEFVRDAMATISDELGLPPSS